MKSIANRTKEVYGLAREVRNIEMPREAKVITYRYYLKTLKALKADAKGAIKYGNVSTSEAKEVIGEIMYNIYRVETYLEELEEKGE